MDTQNPSGDLAEQARIEAHKVYPVTRPGEPSGWLGQHCQIAYADGYLAGAASVIPEDIRRAKAAAWAEGYGVGYADQANRDTTMPYPENPYEKGDDR